MRKLIMMLTAAVALGIALTGSGETVTNVRGAQRPNSNLIDIYYDLDAVDGWSYTVEVAIEGRTNEVTATTFSGDVGEGVAPGKNHHVVWEAGADWLGKKGDVKVIVTATVEAKKGKPKKVQLWEGGPYWADRNIGANKPWESGLYFCWGDTTGHRPSGTTFGFSFDSSNCPTWKKSMDQLRSEGWITSNNVLAPSHDAAHVLWGGAWRMPTVAELSRLNDRCDRTWATINGVTGYVFRGRGEYASASIFLPFVGEGVRNSLNFSDCMYWSSTANTGYDTYSWALRFFSSYTACDHGARSGGHSIRPVQ